MQIDNRKIVPTADFPNVSPPSRRRRNRLVLE